MANNLPNILIVDDEPNILYVLTHTLTEDRYLVDTASNGMDAIEKIRRYSYHVILLDLNMQPVTGLNVLKSLREINQETVVIILTAFSTVDSAIDALRLGAFDYLIKPVDPEAIRERVNEGIKKYEQAMLQKKLQIQLSSLHQTLRTLDPAVGSQVSASAPENLIESGALEIDLDHRKARIDGRDLDLTSTEFKLLVCLVESAPKPVSPGTLVQRVLGYATTANEAGEIIKYHIHNLRQKVEPDPMKPIYIKTIRFEGYMWCG
jgi:DNA-binding response OmpR family regulator